MGLLVGMGPLPGPQPRSGLLKERRNTHSRLEMEKSSIIIQVGRPTSHVSGLFRTALTVIAVALWASLASTALADTRAPQVAGRFYPNDPTELTRVITELLDRLPEPVETRKPRVLIAPHAGLRYSGPVAAAAFRLVKGRTYDGVVVVGFTHRLQFPGISVDTIEAYETPLGLIPVDLEAVQFLQTQDPALNHHNRAHASGEHSLEVMLPFLQVALGEFQLIPVLMGSSTLEDASALAEALADLARRGDYLFVFSTDLSHYHPYEDAKQIDARTVNAMLFETPQAVNRLFSLGVLEACGRGPIVASFLLAAKLGYLERELIGYANSGDTAGDPARVVGYASVALFDRELPAEALLSYEAGMALVRAARETLERALIHDESHPKVMLDQYPELMQAHGIFVTLRRKGLLCGCIGRIEPDKPLAETVSIVALDAALRDGRFEPVKGEDLDQIRVEVSVLTRPMGIGDLRELVPGRDGVILEVDGRSGVFLPTVWTETGWTRLEFLRELAAQKAGLDPDAWQRAALYVFHDQVFYEP